MTRAESGAARAVTRLSITALVVWLLARNAEIAVAHIVAKVTVKCFETNCPAIAFALTTQLSITRIREDMMRQI